MTEVWTHDIEIGQIALPRMGDDLFATGEFETMVTIWSLRKHTTIGCLATILDFGGTRLSLIVKDQPIVVAGSWRKGAAAYGGQTGSILWSRPDLKNIQQVRDLSHNTSALVGIGLQDGAYHILDVHSGRGWSKLQNVREVYGSAFDPLYLLIRSDKTVHLSFDFKSPSVWKRPLVSFGILHAAFSQQQVAYSEASGSTYCIDFNGSELWRFQPEPGYHVTRIAWNSETQRWLAIGWNFQQGGPKLLFAIQPNGNAEVIANIGECLVAEFSPTGSHIITSAGEVISVQSGMQVWRFARNPSHSA